MFEHIEIRTVAESTVLYCPVLYFTVLSCPELSCSIMSCTVLYYHVLNYPELSCTIMSWTILYYHVLYCPVLYCPVLSCTVLLCSHRCSLSVSLYNFLKSSCFLVSIEAMSDLSQGRELTGSPFPTFPHALFSRLVNLSLVSPLKSWAR